VLFQEHYPRPDAETAAILFFVLIIKNVLKMLKCLCGVVGLSLKHFWG